MTPDYLHKLNDEQLIQRIRNGKWSVKTAASRELELRKHYHGDFMKGTTEEQNCVVCGHRKHNGRCNVSYFDYDSETTCDCEIVKM